MASVTIGGGPLGDAGPAITRNLERMLTEASALLEGAVKSETPIGVTEAARGSIASEVRRGGGPGGMPLATVGSPLKHVAVINDGRRPGERPPPAEALELWVRRKIRIERVHAGGKKAGQAKTRSGKVLTRQPTVKEAKGIAFVIARSIGVKGIEGRHFFEKAIEDNQRTLERIFAAGGMQISVDIARGKR